ncbi:hypothetical protein ACHAXR_009124 [Thalassiosira sp. AJA248-18]
MSSKVFSDLQWKDEVDADERMKRKAASRRDSKAAKTNKKAKKGSKPSSEAADAPAGKRSKQDGKKRSRSKGASASSKKSIKKLRAQRRIQQTKEAKRAEEEEARKRARKNDLALDDHAGNIIAAAQDDAAEDVAAPEDFFWEVEAVVGRRIRRGRAEYLIRWKGCSEDDNTWEPAANLCDTAMEEATKYTKALKLKEKQREEDEKKLFGAHDDAVDVKNGGITKDDSMPDAENVIVIDDGPNAAGGKTDDSMAVDPEPAGPAVVDDHLWKWSDTDQVMFREVERIDVNDPHAAKIVKEARINGTPLVLVGHVGWGNFAKRWLTKKKKKKVVAENKEILDTKGENKAESEGGDAKPMEVVDLFAAETIDTGKPSAIASGSTSRGGKDKCTGMEVDNGPGTAAEKEDSIAIKACAEAAVKEVVSGLVTTVEKDSIANEASAKAAVMEVDTTVEKDDSVAVIETSAKAAVDEKASGNEQTQEGKRKEPNMASKEECKAPSNDSSSDGLLDLSKQNYELDVKKMIKDIGEEDVPVIKRHYNEEKPIHGRIAAEKFLTNCWPTEGVPQQEEKTTKNQRNPSNLYLHQWQFPLSDTAGRKLCHQNNPLPKGIMGEDLLKYWLDLPQCKLDSPLQYIFMGREDTLSKLHRDPGGLEISIAPIVGQKECVLVHRSDGSNCLYHLSASLEDIDLQRHPLLTQARAWQTTVQPGEILLMPYGTYHQCRNVTPCLSYSRFHLDTVNLLPFVQSLVNGDAPEIDHEEVLWNLTSELIKRVDGVFDEVQSRVKAGLDEGDLISADVAETVNTLRTLRHFTREVARREEIRQVVKGTSQESGATKNSEDHNFGMLLDDVDMCLHEFRYRQSKKVPPFKPRRGKALKNTLSGASGGRKDVIRRDVSKFEKGGKPVVAFNTSLENNYMSLVNADVVKHFPNASKDKVGESLISELVPGDKISVKLEQKHVKAEVVEILPQMKSAYLSFEDYPSVYDEYQPYELIRLPTGAEIPPEDIKPGLVVIDLSNSNEYRANILSTINGPMARVKLIVSQHEMIRLVSPAMILGRYAPKKRSKQTHAKMQSTKAVAEEAAPVIMRPTKAGQIVEVGRRGAARVTKAHGEPATHVDVRFILGTAHSESMIPIEMVQLAPELDPESGRGRRQITASSKKTASLDENEAESNGADASKKNHALADVVVSPSTIDSSGD